MKLANTKLSEFISNFLYVRYISKTGEKWLTTRVLKSHRSNMSVI